jgi:hypothetical protein
LDRADEVMQKGEAEYAVHKGHDCGTGIEVVLVLTGCEFSGVHTLLILAVG